MDPNSDSKLTSVLSIPPAPARVQQQSIRSFFQPRTPNYTPPPNAQTSTTSPPFSPVQSQSSSPSRSVSNNGPSTPNQHPSLPQQATISNIDTSHIQSLRRINSLLLPINYPDSFYHKILDLSTPSFSRVILWTDNPSMPPKVIGGLVCRLDPALAPDSTPQNTKFVEGVYEVYVQSLVLLSPYRGMGLAAATLQSVIDAATQQIRFKIQGLYAHVWTENKEALAWYAARGFLTEEPVLTGYYKRLKPESARILRRPLGVSDHLAQASTVSLPPTSPTPPSQPSISSPPKDSTNSMFADASKVLPAQRRPAAPPHASSFQDRRPDREWNDLPEDVLDSSFLKLPSADSARGGSAASSRSSSRSGTGKKKKERLYPAAAFGS